MAKEEKEVRKEKVEAGEVTTTTYHRGSEVIRIDKTVDVDAEFISKAFSKEQ